MASSALEVKIETLLAVLDEESESMQIVLRQLDRLRTLLIKRDDEGLGQLLSDLAARSETRADIERRRQELRGELADELQCDPAELTLSRLVHQAPQTQREAVMKRQKTLRLLVGRLKREHKLTSQLVADCARFNQSLLRVFFGQGGRGAVSYGANGAPVRRPDAALMSLHL
jgi:hypothetical protein